MSAAPTPGPYTLGHKETTLAGGMSVEIDAPDHGAIAVAVWRMEDDAIVGKSSPRLESTAQLLAASFDLAEALRPFARLLVVDDAICHRGITTSAQCGRCGPILRARQALAKAGLK